MDHNRGSHLAGGVFRRRRAVCVAPQRKGSSDGKEERTSSLELLSGRLHLLVLILTSASSLLSLPQLGHTEALVNRISSSASSENTGECVQSQSARVVVIIVLQ